MDAFNTGWVSRYGAPAILLTDQGSEFNNGEMRRYLHDLDIQHRRTIEYRPCPKPGENPVRHIS